MKKISSLLFLSVFATSLFTACDDDDKKTEEKEELHGINLAYMDTTTSPKEDFFRYVNGTWLDSTEIPEDQTRWGSFNELRKQTDDDVLAVLNGAMKNDSLDPASDEAKAVKLYESIMDTVSRNEQGVKPLQPYLAKIDSIQNKEDLQKFLIDMSEYGSAGFFSFGVRADRKDSNMNVAYLNPSGLGLPDRDYYVKDDADSKDKREKYKAYIAEMLQYLDYSEEDAKTEADKILAFETSLAEPQMDKVERRDARKTYNPTSISQLQKNVPAMNWKAYFEGIGAKDLDTIVVSQPGYMKALQQLLAKNSVEDWKAYLKWNLFNDAAPALTTELERKNWEFYDKTLRGAQQQRPRDERALQTVNRTLGEALGKLYVEQNFPPEAKEKAQEMIGNIVKAYENRINNLTWMSEDTKKKALEKLSSFTVKVGYPDKWKDYSELEIASPEDGGSYFQNMLNAQKWRVADNLADLGQPVDKTEWYMPPQTVNAYYNPSFNEIVFPAAILQPPFYDYKADAAVNYGGIGAVIGHEISHGFDDSGARFDAEGNLNNWWTDEDLKQFEELGGSLADQYSAIEVADSTFINGKFTLGENIGDLGGVNAAYDGLQIHLKEHGDPGKIDGFTPEQRFFLSWATVWRTKMRDEALKNQIKTDPHSPGMYRAYVPLQNIDAFYDAFAIEEGDPMWVKPEERVRIW
ncbi:MAG: M13 family metallopeptidase [Bacteroidota bacterium]|uniref:Peptidase, M13 family n=1 Tax=Christiangramia flava JLT2011 TaxID=1229726 RepID=A0A1L7I455_9FLAO|nr:M13 family metallopeptidase [Christiangramia flava]APU67915.1 Peptidase, M13 family [Christiangramia flava JLT2011]MEE2772614.1 M13 family metallopeptidase [Bacteroidota bacterium]OSS40417.1 Peptidase, M13 family [Christiangramia flava JLT2011]